MPNETRPGRGPGDPAASTDAEGAVAPRAEGDARVGAAAASANDAESGRLSRELEIQSRPFFPDVTLEGVVTWLGFGAAVLVLMGGGAISALAAAAIGPLAFLPVLPLIGVVAYLAMLRDHGALAGIVLLAVFLLGGIAWSWSIRQPIVGLPLVAGLVIGAGLLTSDRYVTSYAVLYWPLTAWGATTRCATYIEPGWACQTLAPLDPATSVATLGVVVVLAVGGLFLGAWLRVRLLGLSRAMDGPSR